jgi:hypothetical protein
MPTFVCILEDYPLPSFLTKWSEFGSMGEYPFATDFYLARSRWRYCQSPQSQPPRRASGDCHSCAFGVTFSDVTDLPPNNALEPTAVGAFTLMSTDNITSPSSATPPSTAVAQLGR